MIQIFKFNKEIEKSNTFEILTGKNLVKFFLKRFLYLVLFIYGTFFLAVAIPFLKAPIKSVYVIGTVASIYYLIRFSNYIIKFFMYRDGSILVSSSVIIIEKNENSIEILASDIDNIEHSFLGNFVIKHKNGIDSFPMSLLLKEDREELLALLIDTKPKRTVQINKVWDVIDAVVVALFLAVHIIQFVVQAYYIPTGSMTSTLVKGDHLFVEKITYGPIIPKMFWMDKPFHLDFLGVREVRRGDIVIFKPPVEADKDKDYIKRCIAISGDSFEIKEDDGVYINGEKINEPYTSKPTSYFGFELGKDKNPIEGIVPEGKVIVMGDNRTNSQDSRYFGYLDVFEIKGKALFLYWNTEKILDFDFSRFGLIN